MPRPLGPALVVLMAVLAAVLIVRLEDRLLEVPAQACAEADAAPWIQAFLSRAPNGSIVVFPKDARCHVARTLDLSVPPEGMDRREGTVFDLNGSTIVREAEPPCERQRDCGAPIIRLALVRGVTLRNGLILGANPPADDPDHFFDPTRSGYHGIAVHGSAGVVLTGLRVSRVGGDCVDIDKGPGDATSADITINGTADAPFTCEFAGRQGISANAVDGLRITNVEFNFIGRSAVDLEPRENWFIRDVTIAGNTFRWINNFAVVGVGSSSTWEDVTVADNVQLGGPDGEPGPAFLFVGNSFQRGPLTIVGNRVLIESHIKHTSGRAEGNVMTANIKDRPCMFTLERSPSFLVQGNEPLRGVEERCEQGAAPGAASVGATQRAPLSLE